MYSSVFNSQSPSGAKKKTQYKMKKIDINILMAIFTEKGQEVARKIIAKGETSSYQKGEAIGFLDAITEVNKVLIYFETLGPACFIISISISK